MVCSQKRIPGLSGMRRLLNVTLHVVRWSCSGKRSFRRLHERGHNRLKRTAVVKLILESLGLYGRSPLSS